MPSFDAVASTGHNVFAALDAVTQLLLHRFNKEHQLLQPKTKSGGHGGAAGTA
jgi:hypothetical protein